MARTIKLDIPKTAEERIAKTKDSLYGLLKRMQARASDGRYYHFEDEDRELAIKFLNQLK